MGLGFGLELVGVGDGLVGVGVGVVGVGHRTLKIAGAWADAIVTAWQRIQAIPHPT